MQEFPLAFGLMQEIMYHWNQKVIFSIEIDHKHIMYTTLIVN